MTTQVTILNDVEVTLLEHSGGDGTIADAARVSSGPGVHSHARDAGLINTLLRKKHGSPFEHTFMKFYIKAPIFVFREFHRHRIGFSYNEMSGRYTTLLPEFYVPQDIRPLINSGTSMNPKFIPGNRNQYVQTKEGLKDLYSRAWKEYENLLGLGIANEVARLVLPVGIMSQMIVSCNARSLMHFLALRTEDERALFPSKPQYEIAMVARKMEAEFATHFPFTYEAFNENERVAP